MPTITVIMGIYNCADTLQEALDSLYGQTYTDFEIVLCDDGSMDNTFDIALQNATNHQNIVLLKNDVNLGLNKTLNKCLSVAQGKYIARMDGDDISVPSRFEKEVTFLEAHPEYAIVSSLMIYFDGNGEFGRDTLHAGEPDISVFNSRAPFCHAPCMVRREAYLKVEGYSENPHLLRVEDYNLWMKMYAEGFRGYNLGEYLYAMRDDRNASKRRTLKARLNGIYAHYIAYKTLDLSFIAFLTYALINVTKGIMPTFVYEYFHKRKTRSLNSCQH